MADSLFDFELLDSADVLVDFDADEALNAVAAAETAQLETDHDEMAILADYVVPPNKTPEDLARDLEAMVTGVNTLSLQATEGTAVVAPLMTKEVEAAALLLLLIFYFGLMFDDTLSCSPRLA